MFYLASQILIWLIAATTLGFFAGWVLWGRSEEIISEDDLEDLRDDLRSWQRRHRELSLKYRALKVRHEGHRSEATDDMPLAN
jgi:hypothetical protein